MPFTYVIADLHGRHDLLVLGLNEIMKRDPGTIITLGDYVDRGPDSRLVIERLMRGVDSPWTLICLKGNHENIMLETIRKPLDPGWWIGNGGGYTLISYGHPNSNVIELSVVPESHLAWIAKLPIFHVDQHRVYVHAWVHPKQRLDRQSEQLMTWTLYKPTTEGGHTDADGVKRHVVHGHHQFEKGPIKKRWRTDLDTFAWYTGRLVVGVFDNDVPGGPVDLIEIKGKPHPEAE